ncbi:MAG TPA: radical SAM protein [Polyangiaceae bacterium]|jgi:MoaA/NifB/PqqE/SkfB family radical SAM enzyme|nr:radical SAM protein [Polyangiaceae bacterium]
MTDVSWLQVEPTTACNLACEFCYGRSMDDAKMSGDEFRALLARFPGLQFLHLQGEGEPLLARDFFAMAAEAKARGILTLTTTNGTLFNKANIEQLLDTGIACLLVSLESPDPAEFHRIRGFHLEKALAGIVALKAAREARGTTLPAIGFAVTVLKSTRHRLRAIFELHRTLGLDGHINVRCLQKTRSYDDVYGATLRDELLDEAEVSEISALERELAAEFFGGPLPVNHPFPERLFALERDVMGRSPGCFWLDSGLYVDADGDVAPCCNIKKRLLRFGDFRHVDLVDLDRKRDALQASLLSGTVPPACDGCNLAESIVRRERARAGLPPSPVPAEPVRMHAARTDDGLVQLRRNP